MEADEIRKSFQSTFTDKKYQAFMKSVNDQLPSPIGFRLAKSPLFLHDKFRDRLINAANHIIDFILCPDFKQTTEKAIQDKWRCANENTYSHIITMDFGIWKDENSQFVQKLIQLQGFPSLQAYLEDAYRTAFDIPDNWTIYYNGFDQTRYLNLLKEVLVGSYQPDEVVLMDAHPYQQATAADFYFTEKYFDIPIVGLSDLKQEGKKQLFYERQCQ